MQQADRVQIHMYTAIQVNMWSFRRNGMAHMITSKTKNKTKRKKMKRKESSSCLTRYLWFAPCGYMQEQVGIILRQITYYNTVNTYYGVLYNVCRIYSNACESVCVCV